MQDGGGRWHFFSRKQVPVFDGPLLADARGRSLDYFIERDLPLPTPALVADEYGNILYDRRGGGMIVHGFISEAEARKWVQEYNKQRGTCI